MLRGTPFLTVVLFIAALLPGACAERAEVSAERGRELYMAYGCAACHGADADGSGPAARLSKIPPRDLTDLPSYVGGTTIDEIALSIEYGMKATGMPAYAELPPDERRSIANWILSVAKETK